MKRATKIGCGFGAALLVLAVGAMISLTIYYAISARRGDRLINEGITALRERKSDLAIARFSAALQTKLDPYRLPFVYAERALAYREKNQLDQAIRDYTEAIRLNPRNNGTYFSRGRVLEKTGKIDEAVRDYTESIRLNPNASSAYSDRGRIFLKRNELDAAIADFSEVIRCRPNDINAYLERSAAYALKKDWNGAMASVESAIALRPADARAHCQRGDVFCKEREWDKAMNEYDEAGRLAPNLVWAWRGRASVFAAKSDFAHALSTYRNARDVCSGDSSIMNDLAWLLAACPDAALRNGKEAVFNANAACQRTKWNNASYIDTLAAAYAEAGDFDQAVNFEGLALQMTNSRLSHREMAQERLKLYQRHQPYHEQQER